MDINNNAPQTIDQKSLMSISKAAKHLGISIDTIRRWEKRGRITAYRSPGGHRYFDKDSLEKLFNRKYTRDPFSPAELKIDNTKVETAQVEEKPNLEKAPLPLQKTEVIFEPPKDKKQNQEVKLKDLLEEKNNKGLQKFDIVAIFLLSTVIILDIVLFIFYFTSA